MKSFRKPSWEEEKCLCDDVEKENEQTRKNFKSLEVAWWKKFYFWRGDGKVSWFNASPYRFIENFALHLIVILNIFVEQKFH